jgi:hypothetical protein
MGRASSESGERRGVYKVLVSKPEKNRPLGTPRLDGRIILRLTFRKWDVGVWTGSSWLRIGTGTCEYDKEPVSSIKCMEFFDYIKIH